MLWLQEIRRSRILLTRCQTNIDITTSMPPTTPRTMAGSDRIPLHEQDVDLGRDGHGLARNGLSPPVEEFIHYH